MEEARHAGYEEAKSNAAIEINNLKKQLESVTHDLVKNLSQAQSLLLVQLQDALPELAVDISKRLFAGFTPPKEVTEAVAKEALEQLYPETENLEITLSVQEAELLTLASPEWMSRYKGLKIIGDSNLALGDCLVKSRFGLTDARQKAKLAALTHSLMGQN
jgi:flagellar assembly protein FliH